MKPSAFTEEHITYARRELKAGTPVAEISRTLGLREQTFDRWQRQVMGMGVAALRRLRQLAEEYRQLTPWVADLTLDTHILKWPLSMRIILEAASYNFRI